MEADTGGVKGERGVSGQRQPFGSLLTRAGDFNMLETLWNIISTFFKKGKTSHAFIITNYHLTNAKQWHLTLFEKRNY